MACEELLGLEVEGDAPAIGWFKSDRRCLCMNGCSSLLTALAF